MTETTETVNDRVAAVYRDLERLESRDQAQVAIPPARRGQAGPSLVYSIRLDRDEMRALEVQAVTAGLKPSVLARNLLRTGLSAPHGNSVLRAVDRVEEALAELRALVP